MSIKQEIKCPHCNKSFPIQEGFKHQAEELKNQKLKKNRNQLLDKKKLKRLIKLKSQNKTKNIRHNQ